MAAATAVAPGMHSFGMLCLIRDKRRRDQKAVLGSIDQFQAYLKEETRNKSWHEINNCK